MANTVWMFLNAAPIANKIFATVIANKIELLDCIVPLHGSPHCATALRDGYSHFDSPFSWLHFTSATSVAIPIINSNQRRPKRYREGWRNRTGGRILKDKRRVVDWQLALVLLWYCCLPAVDLRRSIMARGYCTCGKSQAERRNQAKTEKYAMYNRCNWLLGKIWTPLLGRKKPLARELASSNN